MITVTFQGPKGGEAGRLASKLASMLSVGGKVVRGDDEHTGKGSLPDPLPTDCNVTIIVRKDAP